MQKNLKIFLSLYAVILFCVGAGIGTEFYLMHEMGKIDQPQINVVSFSNEPYDMNTVMSTYNIYIMDTHTSERYNELKERMDNIMMFTNIMVAVSWIFPIAFLLFKEELLNGGR